MEKEIFKDLLFNVLNEYGEEEIDIGDIRVREKEDAIELELLDGSQFEVKIKKIA